MRNFFSGCTAVLFALFVTPSVAQDSPRVIDLEGDSFYVVSGVNVRNGNFAVTYKTSGDGEEVSGLPFERTYNSMSTNQGRFGVGWGSPWDTRMLYMPDGTVIVHENGNGNYAVYGEASKDQRSEGDERIIEAIKRIDPSVLTDVYGDNLRTSAAARFEAVLKYGPKEPFPKMTELEVDNSTVYSSERCPFSSIERISAPLVFRTKSGFGCDGQLMQIFDLAGSLVTLEVKVPKKEQSRSLNIVENGPVITLLTDEAGKVTQFEYDNKYQLVRQVYPDGGKQTFAYDARGNMTSITYIDNTKQTMTYDEKDRTTSVTKRMGESSRFEYLQDPYNPTIPLTRVTVKNDHGTQTTIFRWQHPS